MQQKYALPIILIIIAVILLGGFLLVKKSPNPYQSSNTTTSTSKEVPSDNIYLMKVDSQKGDYLTDFAEKTLYTYEKDTNGVSNCSGECAVTWPPYTSGAVSQKVFPKDITVITRTDGTKQFAWKGMPLYYFVSDKNPGDMNGDDSEGFHLAK